MSGVLRTGEVVPDFTLPDEHGQPTRLAELFQGGPVVLFFYPAAMSSGCTRESCHFRDLSKEFGAVGATRVGISADTVEKQNAFSGKYGLDFPLLSDSDGAVARSFGVRRGIRVLPNRRATFVIGADRRLLGSVHSELRMHHHAEAALEILRQQGR